MDSDFSVDHTQYFMDMFGGIFSTIWAVSFILCIFMLIANWKIFKKAGEHGVAAIVPFWNTAVLFKLTWGKWYFMFWMCVPFVNLVIAIITIFKLAKVFGKGIGFGFGLLFLSPIFMMILGFGSAQYVGIDGQNRPVDKKESVSPVILESEENNTEEQESLPLETEVSSTNKTGRSWSV